MRTTNPKLQTFTDWLATPEEDRDIETMGEFSQVHGVPVPTLYRWRNKLGAKPDQDEVDMFIARLYKLAMSGKNARYAELWAKIKGIISDKSQEIPERTLSADDMFRIQRKAEKQLEEQGYSLVGICDLCRNSGKLRKSYYTLVKGKLVEWGTQDG